jgi:hypothetical protein
MLSRRIGNFFIILGGLLIFLFVFSDLAKTPKYNLLVMGALGVLFGLVLTWSNPPPPPQPSERFRLLKGMGKKPAHGGAPKPTGAPSPKPGGEAPSKPGSASSPRPGGKPPPGKK